MRISKLAFGSPKRSLILLAHLFLPTKPIYDYYRSVKDVLMIEINDLSAVKSNYVLSYRCAELIFQYCRPGLDRSLLESTYGFLGYLVLHWPEHASLAET